MNILIERAGLSREFTPEFLSASGNIDIVKARINSIEDEDDRLSAVMYFPDALILAHKWDEAEAALNFPSDVASEYPQEQALACLRIADFFLEQGFSARAMLLVDRAVNIAQKIETPALKAEALNIAARCYSATTQPQRALELRLVAANIAAEDQDNDIDCSSVMKEIVKDLVETGELPTARKVASAIRNRMRFLIAWSMIDESEGKAGQPRLKTK